jgi:arsenite methyltransferase
VRGRYGIDAPKVVVVFGAFSTVVTVAAFALTDLAQGWFGTAAGSVAHWVLVGYAGMCWGAWGWSVHGSVVGKRVIWRRLLDELRLTGNERVLELGPGRGAVLVELARRLPRGCAVGVDLWRVEDQSGNAPERLLANAVRAGVAERVRIVTGDMRALPFEARSFALVVASLAIHNLPADDQRRAVDEALRVVARDGRILLLDYRDTERCADLLRAAGARNVVLGGRSWRMYPPVRVVHAISPEPA